MTKLTDLISQERIRLDPEGYYLTGRFHTQHSRFFLDLMRVPYSAGCAVKHKVITFLYGSQIPQIDPIELLLGDYSFQKEGGLPKRTRLLFCVVTEKKAFSDYQYEFYGNKKYEKPNNGKIILISDDRLLREVAEEVSDKFDAPESFDKAKIKLRQQTYGAIVVELLAEGSYVSGSETKYARIFSEEFISELHVGRYGFANFDTDVIGYYQLNFKFGVGEDHRVVAKNYPRGDLEKILQIAEEKSLLSDDRTSGIKDGERNLEHLTRHYLLAT